MAEEDNRKPWEDLGEAPTENWRERKGQTSGSRDESEGGHHEDWESKRSGARDDFKNKGGRGFKKRDGGRGFSKRGRDNFKSKGKRFGRRDGAGRGWDGDNSRRDSGQGYGRDSEHYSRGERDERGNRFSRDRGRQDRYERRDRGSYGRSRTFDSKRGQGSTGRGRNLDIPASVTWEMLDKEAWTRLSPLPKETAELVARHLVMSGELVDSNPELAYEHAKAALKMAWRIDVVREAVALTSYACGNYAEALREVRTVRRMSGMDVLRAIEADSERGLGKPEKALDLISQTDLGSLEDSERLELAIIESAARADMGEYETGLAVIEKALQGIDLDKQSFEYGRLLSVKADRLRELGFALEAEETMALIPREVEETPIIDLAEESEAEEKANPTTMKGTNIALARQYPLILCDLDGVTWNGEQPVPTASAGIETVRKLDGKVMFLTNNAARQPQEVVEKLQAAGIPSETNDIVTSAQDGAQMLSHLVEEGGKVLCIGGPGVAASVKEVGLVPVSSAQDEPVAVLQGLGFDVGWKELSEVCYAINAGAKWVVTNMDLVLPTEKGRGIGNGSLVTAVKTATRMEPIVCGKPEESIYNLAVSRAKDYLLALPEVKAQIQALCDGWEEEHAQSDPRDPDAEPSEQELAEASIRSEKKFAKKERRLLKTHAVAVGDQLPTDVLGAHNAGIDTCVVLTGLTRPRDLVLAPQTQRPEFVALDLTDLAQPFDRPELRARGWWYCGNTRARVTDRQIEVRGLGFLQDGTEVSLEEFRALLCAVWYAREQGVRVQCPDFTVVRSLERDYSSEDEEELSPLEDDFSQPADTQNEETDGQDDETPSTAESVTTEEEA